jgi:threonine/homoserine/homoserine lactone efflux protein
MLNGEHGKIVIDGAAAALSVLAAVASFLQPAVAIVMLIGGAYLLYLRIKIARAELEDRRRKAREENPDD